MLLLTLVAIGASAPSASAAQWLPTTDISDTFNPNAGQQLAVDSAGAAQVSWVLDGTSTDRLLTRRVAADGTLGPVLPVDSGSNIGTPSLAMDPAGEAILAWVNGASLKFIQLDAGGDPIGTATTLASNGGQGLKVVLDDGGNATLVWAESVIVGSDINAALRYSRIPAGGSPTAPATFFTVPGSSVTTVVGTIALGVDPGGVVTAGWTDQEIPSFDDNVRVIHIDPGTGPDPLPTILDTFTNSSTRALQLGVDTSGDAVALWRNPSFWRAQQVSAGYPPTVGTIHDLSTAAATLGDGAISVQPDGSAVAGWAENVLGTVAQRLLADDTLDPQQILSPDFNSYLTSALTAGGGTVFAWTRNDGSFNLVESRRLDSSDALSPTDTPLSDPSSDAENLMAAGTATGQPSLVWDWLVPGGGDSVVQLTSYDATPPVITSAAGSPTGSVGQQLLFAASATDRSGISSYDWDFGDGAGASGPIVQHSYGAPGTYTVTLTVTDNFGNQSVSQLMVTVTAAGGGASPQGFAIGGVQGRILTVYAPSAGQVKVNDAGARGASASAIASKRRRKLRPSSATGGPGFVRVRLRLTKAANRALKRKGRLKARAIVSFTPTAGSPISHVVGLRLP